MIFLDFETQSTVDLKEVGSKKYIDHIDTEMLSLVCKQKDHILIWLNPNTSPDYVFNKHNFEHPLIDHKKVSIEIVRSSIIPHKLFHYYGKEILCAHNATFDRMCWEKFVSKELIRWFDTLPCARAGGYPGELDKLSQIITGHSKDEGKQAMKILTQVKIKNGKKVRPIGTKVLWEQLIQYNIVDVLLLEMIYDKVKNYGEKDVIEVDRIINDRGIAVDRKLINNLYALYTHNEVHSKSEWDVITGELNPRSPKQVKDWLLTKGYKVDSLNKMNLQTFFEHPDTSETDEELERDTSSVLEALRLRQNIVRAGKSKIERIMTLTQLDVDIISHQLVIYGTHPGRWSGRGLQPHNFARGRDIVNVEKLLHTKRKLTLKDIVREANTATDKALEKGEQPVSVSDVLSTLTRSVLIPRKGKIFGIQDFGQIQLRTVAWLADETILLDQFAKGHDPYKYMAGKIFGIDPVDVTKEQRQLGKIVDLACGFSMSAGKFDANCRIIYNVNLAAAGTSATECVNTFRETYKKIAGSPRSRTGLWQKYHDAAHEVINTGEQVVVGKCVFGYDNNTFSIKLPSGRCIYYRNAHIKDCIPSYCATLGIPEIYVPTVCYTHPHGYEGRLYGGLITENIAMAVESDILASCLPRLERDGMPVVLHVHDEIVSELSNKLDLYRMGEIMSTSPDWALNFPILVEGYTCEYYTKSKFASSLTCKYLNGKAVK